MIMSRKMKLLSGKPFFTKTRTLFILRRIVLPFFAVYSVLAVFTAIRDMNIKSNQYAAVLLSDHALTQYDYWVSPSAFLGSYITWTYYFNNKDMRVKWFLRAKSTDLTKVMRDGNCQSIVLVGHGSVNTWKATDMVVSNLEVEEMMNGVPKKKGEWLQLTCGEEDYSPVRMGELVMEKENVHTYGKAATTYMFMADAVSCFKYLKRTER
jgi:hypothetical protein